MIFCRGFVWKTLDFTVAARKKVHRPPKTFLGNKQQSKLYADLHQKSMAFCLASERRLCEEDGKTVKIYKVLKFSTDAFCGRK
jgi:hypothetical protein